jgi:hypothetical protein
MALAAPAIANQPRQLKDVKAPELRFERLYGNEAAKEAAFTQTPW